MTKFDHKVNLPDIFADNNLSILPISRGEYIISSFNAYMNFESSDDAEMSRITIPPFIQSLSPQFLVSEAIALNCANACNILCDFLEDDEILPTVNGRMGSGKFSFNINTSNGIRNVEVNNSQIEIDAAYEGINYLSLFEAKRDLADDFLIRQLYYPLRTWEHRVTKPIKTVFLVFSNGIFHLYQYQFENPNNYNSLRLVKHKKYFITTDIRLTDIEGLLYKIREIREPYIPFPQANDMYRIINLIELLYEKPMSKNEITTKYAFDKRQTFYYTDAGRYLGLISKNNNGGIIFYLTEKGKHIMELSFEQRQLAIAAQILEHKVFREILKLHLRSGEMPDKNTIVAIMKNSGLYNVNSDNTYERRSSTVVGWINWILSLINEY